MGSLDKRAFAQWTSPMEDWEKGHQRPGSPETLRNEPDITEISLKETQKIEPNRLG